MCIRDRWFIDKLAILVEMEQALQAKELDEDLLREAKRLEFPDYLVAKLAGKTEEEVKALRKQYDITAAYKMVDTCAAEFAATTPYYYSVYGGENEAVETNDRKKVLVLGSGPVSYTHLSSRLRSLPAGDKSDFCKLPGDHSAAALWLLRIDRQRPRCG